MKEELKDFIRHRTQPTDARQTTAQPKSHEEVSFLAGKVVYKAIHKYKGDR